MVFRIVFSMISFIIIFNGITDFYFHKRVISRFSKNNLLRKIHFSINGFFILLLIWLGIEFLSPESNPESTLYVWGMLIYFLYYLPKLTYVLVTLPELIWPKQKFFSIIGSICGISVIAILIWGSTFGRFDFVTRKIEIHSKKLPRNFDNYRIIQFSDTHLGNFGHSTKIIEELVRRINSLKPDLIVFTGDLVNTKAGEIDQFTSILSNLKAKDGVYSIMGNHDYGDYVLWKNKSDYDKNLKQLFQKQSKLGWHLMLNESKYLHRESDSIALIAVENWGEPPFHQYGDLKKALEKVKDNGFRILLSHNPEHWRLEVAPKFDIDLTLSGHTHAMQFAYKLGDKRYSPAVFKYKNWGGLFKSNSKYLYVNEGIGYVLFPMRFGAGPEITQITLRHSNISSD